jgi:lipocalin
MAALGGAALILGVWTTASSASLAKSHTTTTTTTTTVPPSNTPVTTVSAADTWLLRAIGAEDKVGSVRIMGSIKQGKTKISLNLLVNDDGEGGGTFVQDGSKIQLKRVGPLLYFNAPTKFWAAHATKSQTSSYGGKWIEVSALDSRFQSFDQFLDASDLVTAVFQGHTNPLTLSRPTTYQGHKVVIVGDSVTVKGKKDSGEMYVATTGPAIVYKIIDMSTNEDGVITFSHYGKAVSITVPPEPINLS